MMARTRTVRVWNGDVPLARGRVCAGFFARLRGLLGRKRLEPGACLLFVPSRGGRLAASTHTLGMRFAIGIIWLDAELRVIDSRLAQPWIIAHVPRAPARYYLEADPAILELARIGDRLRIDGDTL